MRNANVKVNVGVAEDCAITAQKLIMSMDELEAEIKRLNAIKKSMHRQRKKTNRILDTTYANEKHLDREPVKGDRIRVKEIYHLFDHTYTHQWMADLIGTVVKVNRATITITLDVCGDAYARIDKNDCYVLA